MDKEPETFVEVLDLLFPTPTIGQMILFLVLAYAMAFLISRIFGYFDRRAKRKKLQ